tara:strand:- start:146 stop:607 length:462 start_codon:yes stop_codon:yes gene_type:complete
MMTDMREDFLELMRRRAAGEDVDDQIIKRHALPWFDGEVEPGPRLDEFTAEARALLPQLDGKADQEMIDAWVDGVSGIDAGNIEENVSMIDHVDFKDLTRHWLNGGTQFGMANNLRDQSPQIMAKAERAALKDAERQGKQILETAQQRFNESE